MRTFRGLGLMALAWLGAAQAVAADYLVGEVKAQRRVTVSAQCEGVVADYSVALGDRVTAGAALVQLDDRDAVLAVALAEAQVALSRAEYDSQRRQLTRLSELAGRQSLAQSELDEQSRVTEVSAAQVQLDSRAEERARRELEKTRLHAPFDAWVAARHVELGQWVNRGDPLFELVQLSRVKVQLVLIEQDKVSLAVGDSMRVYLPALERSLLGRVSRIAPALSSDGRGYLAELALANDQLDILPGFRAEVTPLEAGQ